VLRYRKYREAFERNRRELDVSPELMVDGYELSLFMKQPDREEFMDF